MYNIMHTGKGDEGDVPGAGFGFHLTVANKLLSAQWQRGNF